MEKDRVTIRETSRIAGKSINTIRNWIKAGKVDAVKKGKVWMIKADTLNGTAGAAARKRAGKKRAGKAASGKVQGGDTTTYRTRQNIVGLEAKIAELEDQKTRLEEENERLREKEEKLRDRIRKVFGPLLAPLAERLLEIG